MMSRPNLSPRSWLHSRDALLMCLFLFLSPLCAQQHLGNLSNYFVQGKAVTLWADTSRIRFVFYQPDIVRVDFLPSPSSVLDSSLVVVQDTSGTVLLSVDDKDSSVVMTTSSLKIVCTKTPIRVGYYTLSSAPLLTESAQDGFASNGSQRIASFRLSANDHFYGTGERGTALDKRGQMFESFNDTFFGYTSPLPRMNINIPFLASAAGYALYFDNSYRGTFDLGSSNASSFSYAASGGELSYFFIAAQSVPAQLERYVWLTGRQPLPPRWAFGYLQSKFGYQTQTEATNIVQMMRAQKIPCDAIILDLYWYQQMGDLTWNSSSWPDPFAMMLSFQRQGIKTIVITEPYVTSLSSNYAEGVAQGLFGKDITGKTYALENFWSCNCPAALLDITNPAAQQWWWNKHPLFLGNDSAGVAGLWTDLGEPERHPDDMQHFLGGSPKVHNLYNLLWAKTVFEGFKKLQPNRRIFNLTRAGFAGIQRYGVIPWSADVGNSYPALEVQLPMLLNMGLSGLAYHNSDIGGFCCGATSSDLYIRWLQFGTFCPITRAHGWQRNTEPWGYGEPAASIAKSYIEYRYRLLPYIYTMAYQNSTTGMPLARPLFFENPSDPSLLSESSTYLWGDNLLVSPVVQSGQTSKLVVLPSGAGWFDYWTGRFFTGGQKVAVAVSLEQMPLFVRAGSIIPMLPLMQFTDEHPMDTLMLAIYPSPGVAGQYTLYEDDGKSLDYLTGSYATTSFAQSLTGADLNATFALNIGPAQGRYDGRPSRRTYVSEIHNVARRPSSVVKNSGIVPECTSYAALRKGTDGFLLDTTTHILYIQTVTNADSAYNLVVGELLVTGIAGNPMPPSAFSLEQNYPNPFNPSTRIRYNLPQRSRVMLIVFNTLGQQVAQLVNGEAEAGYHEVQFDGKDLSSGVYFYRIQVRPLDFPLLDSAPGGILGSGTAIGRDSNSGAGDPSLRSGQGFVQARKLLLLR